MRNKINRLWLWLARVIASWIKHPEWRARVITEARRVGE